MADSSPRDQAQQAAGAATEQGREVAEHAKAQAGAVAGTARQQAGAVAGEARARAMTVVSDATRQAQEQGDAQAQRLAGSFRDASRQLRSMADGDPQSGPVMDLTRHAGDWLEEWAGKLDDGGVRGVAGDLQRYARRRPGAFLLGAGVAGFFAGRLLRNADLDAVKEAVTGGDQGAGEVGTAAPSAEVGMGEGSPIDVAPAAMGVGGTGSGDLGAGGTATGGMTTGDISVLAPTAELVDAPATNVGTPAGAPGALAEDAAPVDEVYEPVAAEGAFGVRPGEGVDSGVPAEGVVPSDRGDRA